MYQISIFNNGIETVIHFPSSDSNDPHLNKLPLSDGLSIVDSLSFSLYRNNIGYQNVFEMTTIVKAKDVRDDTIRFIGRILNISEKMETDGNIYKDISCEGALSFLNDTKQRANTFATVDVQTFLTQLLNIHNSKVEPYKRIVIGNINVVGSVAHTCEFKTTLAELLAVKESIGGNIHVREVNNVLYLDWLKEFNVNTVNVILGTNMKDMVASKDITSFGTRIIPLGANNLTIESVNGGIDYIEDVSSKNVYGVIEKTVEFKDIEDASTLMNTCVSNLKKYTQPLYLLTINALDLSYISGIKADQFVLGTKIHLINPIMAIDDIYEVVQINLDLLTPYNPKLTISNTQVTINNTINDLRATTIQNNGVYNNVQIGSAFGIRAVRSDNKVITTINATDGITIENNNKKVFLVDTNGNIVVNDITANNMRANGGIFNKITATDGLIIEDGNTICEINVDGMKLTGADGKIAKIGIIDDPGHTGVYVPDDLFIRDWLEAGRANFKGDVFINGITIQDYIMNIIDDSSFATKNWVQNNFEPKSTE